MALDLVRGHLFIHAKGGAMVRGLFMTVILLLVVRLSPAAWNWWTELLVLIEDYLGADFFYRERQLIRADGRPSESANVPFLQLRTDTLLATGLSAGVTKSDAVSVDSQRRLLRIRVVASIAAA